MDNSGREADKSEKKEKSDKADAKIVKEERRRRFAENFSYVWTVISALYVIICTCVLIGKKWIDSPVTYALIGILAALVIVFILILGLTRADRKSGRKHLSVYSKLIKIFKASSTVVFLVLTAIAMTGVAESGMDALGWLVFIFTFLVALLQLAMHIVTLVLKFYHRRIGRDYEVKVVKFVNGKRKESKTVNKIYSKIYKDDE